MKKITETIKQIKDLSFLLSLPKQQISEGILKRTQINGRGDTIKDIKVPCHIYISFYKYDYQGKFHSQTLNVCIRDFNKRTNSQIPEGVYQAIQTMKVQEKSWFNFRHPQLHGVIGLPQEGLHFYIVIEDIKYKNSDTIQSKKLVSQQLRKQGAQLFKKGDYQEALKRYKKQIHISQGIEKKKYSQSQMEQIKLMNTKAKKNFLKCFVKLTNFDENLGTTADQYSKQLLKLDNNDVSYKYLRAQVLLQRKYLSLALQLAEEVKKQNQEDGGRLVQQIKQRLNKNK